MSSHLGGDAPAERSAVVDGVNVLYFVSDATSDTAAAPVVLVHGAGGSTAAQFSYLLPLLARRRRVIAVDFSQPIGVAPTELTVEHLARQVIGVIEAEAGGQAVALLGYSLGAVVSVSVAAVRPDLIDRLILVNGWLQTDQQQALRNTIWKTLRAEKSAALGGFMAFCAMSATFMSFLHPTEMAGIAASLGVDEFFGMQMDLAGRIDLTEKAERISAPTLVIGSRDDVMAPPHHSKALFGAIDDARYMEIAAGHAVLHERVVEVLRAAEIFLDKPSGHPAGSVISAERH